MIRFAAMLGELPRDPKALGRYLKKAPRADAAAAQDLLAGLRPRRVMSLDALLSLATEAAGLPQWLIDEALAASGDRAEVAAQILPDPEGRPPGLAEVVAALHGAGSDEAREVLADLWRRLPPEARHVVNRLATGTFRAKAPAPPRLPEHGPERRVRAVMIQAAPAKGEITLAMWQGNALVPVARLRLDLPEAPEILAWVRDHVVERFGPVRTLPPLQVFELAFAGTEPNPRRKCGLDLIAPRLHAWLGEANVAEPVAALLAERPGGS